MILQKTLDNAVFILTDIISKVIWLIVEYLIYLSGQSTIDYPSELLGKVQ